jgi:hypothetical protein
MGLDRKPWLAVYKHCTRDEFSFMYLNFFFKRGERIWKNFDEIIHVTEEDIDTSEDEMEEDGMEEDFSKKRKRNNAPPKKRKRNNV